MDKVFKYLGYAAISFLIAWISTLGKVDYIGILCNSIVQLLIALLALYSTISSLLVSRLLSFWESVSHKADIKPVIEAMKRNVRIESILIFMSLLVIIISNFVVAKQLMSEIIIYMIRNTVVVFCLLYFVIVVYDSSMGLYDLLEDETDGK